MSRPDPRTRYPRTRARLTVAAVMLAAIAAAVLAIAAPLIAVAQDESPAVSGEPAASGAPGTDLVALIPEELAGIALPREEIIVRAGADLTQGSPDIEAQYQAIVDATGVPLEEMSQAAAYVQSDDGELLNLAVLRVPGADAAVVRDVVMPVVLASWDGAEAEDGELSGLAVTIIRNDSPDVDDLYLYPAGDLLWIVSGLEEVVAQTLADIAG
jgi:hypothetical protein